MLFNSFNFIVFFIVVTSLYWLANLRYRQILLLLASCAFYMAFIPQYILILFATIMVDYIAGLYIERTNNAVLKKRYLIISIISTCAILFVFKYFNFFIENVALSCKAFGMHCEISTLQIILPIGLSFHTFQSLSYVIEVYRGNQKAERDVFIYSLYVMFYPQLVAGPIERPANLLNQLNVKKQFKWDDIRVGLLIMSWGFFKKVVIADRLALMVSPVYAAPETFDPYMGLLATYFFAIQIYCDFSGYSDIARGVAKMMGYDLMVNFNFPYMAKSVSEFWKRWHISLSTWFRDYLYVPLGGNRVSAFRKKLNLLITFTVSGLWHGANWTYVIWGGLNGVYLILEQMLPLRILKRSRIWGVFKIILVFHLILISWVFFRAKDIHTALLIIKRIADVNLNSIFISFKHLFVSFGVIWFPSMSKVVIPFYDSRVEVYSFILLFIVAIVNTHYLTSINQFLRKYSVSYYLLSIFLFSLVMLFGELFRNSDFIYFQF